LSGLSVRFERPGAAPRSTPSGYGLPPDLLRQSRRRVRIVGLLVLLATGADTILMVIDLVLWWLSPDPPPFTNQIPFAGNLLALTGAVIVVAAASSRRVRDTTLLQLALGFEVFLSVTLSLSNPVSVYELNGSLPTLTWVTPLIIFFPLIVPCPPRRTVITAVLAASTRPLGLWVLSLTGQIPVPAGEYFTAIFSPTLAVVIAYFGSRVVYGLGIEVAHARQMGSYVLERQLGRGGMGEVWLGRHRMLARPAAVKLIRSDIAGAAAEEGLVRRRFEREAQTTAALRSPHTIELFDYGVSDDGVFYYVMELLDGLDTDALVRRFGPLSADRVIWILRQACHSLAEAHDAGLVHRDIKPANIFLCRYGRDFDFVKVMDFGLVTPPAGDQDGTRTSEGTLHGTPAFMAPEQVKGERADDPRSDLYALGCVAYWLLTGHFVFEGGSPVEVLVDHVHTPPVPPSQRTELPLPPALEEAVMACLHKDPDQRPQSAGALAELVASCAVEQEWSNERARAWWLAHFADAAPGAIGDQASAGTAAR